MYFVCLCFVFLSFFKAHISEHLLAKKKSHCCSWKKITTYEWLLWIYQANLSWYLHELIKWRAWSIRAGIWCRLFLICFISYLFLLEHLSCDNERKHQWFEGWRMDGSVMHVKMTKSIRCDNVGQTSMGLRTARRYIILVIINALLPNYPIWQTESW